MTIHAAMLARISQARSRRLVAGDEGSAEILSGSAIIADSAEGVPGMNRSLSAVVSIFCSWTIISGIATSKNLFLFERLEGVL